jgi:hypothetical protein
MILPVSDDQSRPGMIEIKDSKPATLSFESIITGRFEPIGETKSHSDEQTRNIDVVIRRETKALYDFWVRFCCLRREHR